MRWAAVMMLAMVMAACGHKTNKDYAAMNKIPMHPVCVGRMLVDLPKGGQMDWQQQIDLAMVSKLPDSINTEAAFLGYVQKRRSELGQPNYGNPKGRMGPVDDISENSTILQFRPESGYDAGYETEGYLFLGYSGYQFKVGGVFNNEASEVLHRIKDSFPEMQLINNAHPPQEPGFCIGGALIAGKIGPIWSGVSVGVKGWKGVSASAGASEDDGSRPRPSWEKGHHALPIPTPFDNLEMFKSWADESKRSGDDDRAVSFEVLRKDNRQLAGMLGEEIAVKATLANGQEWYRFEWNSPNDTTKSQKPGFAFGLEAGKKDYTPDYVPPPSQDDLLALWDAMLDSLKPRPGAR
jgi:hypothetical protein